MRPHDAFDLARLLRRRFSTADKWMLLLLLAAMGLLLLV